MVRKLSSTRIHRIQSSRRSFRAIRTVAIGAVIIMLAACGGGGSGGGGGGGGGGNPAGPNPPPAGGSSVTITDSGFSPSPLNVTAGTTVRWTNSGSVVHNVVSDTGIWNSGSLNPNAQFERQFTTAGTYPYTCTIHAGMAGTIVVS